MFCFVNSTAFLNVFFSLLFFCYFLLFLCFFVVVLALLYLLPYSCIYIRLNHICFELVFFSSSVSMHCTQYQIILFLWCDWFLKIKEQNVLRAGAHNVMIITEWSTSDDVTIQWIRKKSLIVYDFTRQDSITFICIEWKSHFCN